MIGKLFEKVDAWAQQDGEKYIPTIHKKRTKSFFVSTKESSETQAPFYIAALAIVVMICFIAMFKASIG